MTKHKQNITKIWLGCTNGHWQLCCVHNTSTNGNKDTEVSHLRVINCNLKGFIGWFDTKIIKDLNFTPAFAKDSTTILKGPIISSFLSVMTKTLSVKSIISKIITNFFSHSATNTNTVWSHFKSIIRLTLFWWTHTYDTQNHTKVWCGQFARDHCGIAWWNNSQQQKLVD